MLAVVGGTVLKKEGLVEGRPRKIKTPYGNAVVIESDPTVFLPRHGVYHNIPPHKINHRANVFALEKLGAKLVVGVASAGSLKTSIPAAAITVPDDYMNLADPPTFHDKNILHITPNFDDRTRSLILVAARKAAVKVIDGGVYAQTRGPRLETKAEVRMLAQFADYVGMTVASEATLFREAGLPYASICSIDNPAHGLSKKEPDFGEITRKSTENAEKIMKVISNIALK